MGSIMYKSAYFRRPTRTGMMNATGRYLVSVALAIFAMSGPAMAQITDLSSVFEAGLAVQGKGWSQITDLQEMGQFLLGIVEATAMTATIAFHPSSLAARKTKADFRMPRTLFAYTLIGMVVGFLVANRGYVIGFVIFGLGGLLRFRNESSADIAKYILVTLLGLCVGIDLPVMALIITISAWFVLYFLNRGAFVTLEVKFAGDQPVNQSLDNLLETLRKKSLETVTMTKSKFKPVVEIVFSSDSKPMRDLLMSEMTALESASPRTVVDWHLT